MSITIGKEHPVYDVVAYIENLQEENRLLQNQVDSFKIFMGRWREGMRPGREGWTNDDQRVFNMFRSFDLLRAVDPKHKEGVCAECYGPINDAAIQISKELEFKKVCCVTCALHSLRRIKDKYAKLTAELNTLLNSGGVG